MHAPSNAPIRVAILTDGDASERRTLSTYLERQGNPPADWFPIKDTDEWDAALSNGRHQRVVFANLDALLRAIWDGHVALKRWRRIESRVELAAVSEAHLDIWRRIAEAACESYDRWSQEYRKRQTLAMMIASAAALVALAALFLLVPRG